VPDTGTPTALKLREAPRGPNEGEDMAGFSLELNDDQLNIQKWVHDFA
jgi:hypothetical protein